MEGLPKALQRTGPTGQEKTCWFSFYLGFEEMQSQKPTLRTDRAQ